MAPKATPETKPYWDGLKEGKLMIQRNKKTGKAYFPPRPFDPEDPFAEVEWFQASGKGTLLTYIISHRPPPGFVAPFSIAVVRLEEGVQMATNIIDCPQTPEALQLDMAVELAPTKVNDDITLPTGGRRGSLIRAHPGKVAIVGASEMVSPEGVFPQYSQLGLHAEPPSRA